MTETRTRNSKLFGLIPHKPYVDPKIEVFKRLRSISDEDKAAIDEQVHFHVQRARLFERISTLGLIGLSLTFIVIFLVPIYSDGDTFVQWYLSSYIVAGIFLLVQSRILAPRFSDSRFLVMLLELIGYIEENEPKWLHLSFRRGCMWRLEQIARIVERDMRRAFRSWDPVTDEWVTQRTWQTAAGLRELKTWFIVPMLSTRQDLLQQRLAPTFVAAAIGNWNEMVRVWHLRAENPSTVVRSLMKIWTTGGRLLAVVVVVGSVFLQTPAGRDLITDLNLSRGVVNTVSVIATAAALLIPVFLNRFGQSAPILEADAKRAAEGMSGLTHPAATTSATVGP